MPSRSIMKSSLDDLSDVLLRLPHKEFMTFVESLVLSQEGGNYDLDTDHGMAEMILNWAVYWDENSEEEDE